MSKFMALEANIKHTNNSYKLYLIGDDPNTSLSMYDAKGDGSFFLIMDNEHPVGLIFNQEEIHFKGKSFGKLVEESLKGLS